MNRVTTNGADEGLRRCIPKSFAWNKFDVMRRKGSSNPSVAVRSDRIHAVCSKIRMSGPDESDHYERDGRMLTMRPSSGASVSPHIGVGPSQAVPLSCPHRSRSAEWSRRGAVRSRQQNKEARDGSDRGKSEVEFSGGRRVVTL